MTPDAADVLKRYLALVGRATALPWTIRRGLPGKPLALKIRSVVPNDDLYDIAELPLKVHGIPAETIGANAKLTVVNANVTAELLTALVGVGHGGCGWGACYRCKAIDPAVELLRAELAKVEVKA